jgi:hypothetical protein
MCLKQGNWMFRHRSYLPLSLVILIVIAAFNAGFFESDSVPAQVSIKAVLRREYSGFFAMVFSLAIVKHLTFFARTGHFEWHFNWLIAVGVAGILYLTLRTLKRKTRILHEAGR